MPIALSDDHKALADTAADFLAKNHALAATRDLLEATTEGRPAFWSDLAKLGWLGLHLPEEHGGSGFGLPELVVVVEQLGRAACPGPFVPTVIASATIEAAGSDELKTALLPGLADGTTTAGIAPSGQLSHSGGAISGTLPAVLGATTADLLVVAVGDDAAVIDRSGDGVTIDELRNIDPARRSAKVTLAGAPAQIIPGGARALLDFTRLLLAAEATGVAALTTEMAAQYARDRSYLQSSPVPLSRRPDRTTLRRPSCPAWPMGRRPPASRRPAR